MGPPQARPYGKRGRGPGRYNMNSFAGFDFVFRVPSSGVSNQTRKGPLPRERSRVSEEGTQARVVVPAVLAVVIPKTFGDFCANLCECDPK